ncbi:YqiA/YcfP family alpha/beta fold hydrolase [Halomonas saccharevitans]|uniref:YqiA/YcfP family alpha/beta fold hydrolase n=1 Tax=Halomonas saccharevitans TaxID=416872 RepID=A0ABU3NF44_9GAMM|nr:YqiA/YcfP family alpha/beta fold hydrolase [Halomonas saccharevitans]MDT8879800.1 YqiA/YcfP family alpha/beta fold hydrolase [Halomonas saccharevitans]
MLSAARRRPAASGVLYLHGFNSGSGSPKAALVREACARLGLPCATPQLPHRPRAALACAEARLAELGSAPLVVGSSMGGFLATLIAERHDLPGVLINPAVAPATLVADWVGQRFDNAYTGERFAIEAAHLEELEALTPGRVTAERYLLLLGTADETLNPRRAFALYRGARVILHPQGDHGFAALADYLPAILAHGGHALSAARLAGREGPAVQATGVQAPGFQAPGIKGTGVPGDTNDRNHFG